MKILIVDDNSSTREMVRIVVQKLGHEVVGECEDGEEAIQAFKTLRPDLVLLDIIMPGKSGIKVLEEIKALDPGAKVIMTTAVDQEDVTARLMEKGAAAMIYKPFAREDFEKAFELLK